MYSNTIVDVRCVLCYSYVLLLLRLVAIESKLLIFVVNLLSSINALSVRAVCAGCKISCNIYPISSAWSWHLHGFDCLFP